MSNAEIAAQKEKIQQKIVKYMQMMLELRDCQEQLRKDLDRFVDDVEKPVADYEIYESGGIGFLSWRGNNADKAEEKKNEIKSSCYQYEEETLVLIDQIGQAIDLLKEKIKKLKKQMAAL
ncbi:hypothetical protein [Butyrivibrio proteoclasticus]|uniref:hypothetical protein n=1 Tax=Butyrivibrio proteoclasticus TaxID=43305 RepID=UPI00047EEADB|nr:hypothetical protein [Butyrivibrio proteoclasticus]